MYITSFVRLWNWFVIVCMFNARVHYDNMVACDDCEQWFHLKCVDLAEPCIGYFLSVLLPIIGIEYNICLLEK